MQLIALLVRGVGELRRLIITTDRPPSISWAFGHSSSFGLCGRQAVGFVFLFVFKPVFLSVVVRPLSV